MSLTPIFPCLAHYIDKYRIIVLEIYENCKKEVTSIRTYFSIDFLKYYIFTSKVKEFCIILSNMFFGLFVLLVCRKGDLYEKTKQVFLFFTGYFSFHKSCSQLPGKRIHCFGSRKFSCRFRSFNGW